MAPTVTVQITSASRSTAPEPGTKKRFGVDSVEVLLEDPQFLPEKTIGSIWEDLYGSYKYRSI